MREMESSFGSQTEELKGKVLEMTAVARERFAEGQEMVKAYVVKEPARALGIALGVGVLFGWLVKRR
jgi:ElaB/YqjD/DUF883 family membrane-anchored ribosome-binding protein